ncbi:Dihydrofolate reductase [Candidatus Ornithobacterium hominis]|uniref:dihydrofolate reductase n=1 Tax=Candidatus Ornithobacterium hominis TaxID=2497989 RepID=UPI000E5AA85A|nr:dihydrofolate reductase [Candidatus Ornithobacterium hominis]SZD73158.1 Dihydrofolate reductase [Candidatus Ornithobacterium hominis]
MIIQIAAISENNILGKDGDLIWHIPEDLKRFKKITLGNPMIMGRKTFESFPSPLPGRLHIVLSSQNQRNTENVIWVQNLEEALEIAKSKNKDIFIIGGGKVFEQTLSITDRLEITRVHETFEGDAFFPEIKEKDWELVDSKAGSDKKYKITYNTYLNKQNSKSWH